MYSHFPKYVSYFQSVLWIQCNSSGATRTSSNIYMKKSESHSLQAPTISSPIVQRSSCTTQETAQVCADILPDGRV